MLKSILVTALRNIYRNRTFSLINLTGLAVSMSLGLLIILLVKEQYGFDNFHNDVDRIYRVNTRAQRVEGGSESYASAPLPIAEVLKEEYTFSENVVRIHRGLSGDAMYGSVNVPIRGVFTDPSFLQVFNFQLDKGNPATALNEPNNLVLTAEAAEKIFGDKNPLGQTLTISGFGEFTVTGVLKKFPGKTHFEFEVLGSATALAPFEKQGALRSSVEEWNNYYSGYVYIKIKEGKSTLEVETALEEMAATYYKNLKLETRDKGYQFYLHPLTEITPGPELSNQMGNGMPTIVIIFLSALAGVIMIMACFNYTNLMIAKSLSRAREIGIRKVVGGARWQVFFQFVGEAVIFSSIALVFSYLLLQFMKPMFSELNVAREFSADLTEGYSLYIYFLLFAVGIGVLAGLLPAGYLSSFQPIKVLKDTSNVKVYSRLTFRKALIVIQFAISVMFIVVVLVVHDQVNYMVTKDYGINEKAIYNVRLQGMEFQKLASEVKSLPGVVNVGGVSHALGTWEDRSSDYKRNREDEPFTMRDFIVDPNYVSNLQIEFVAGNNFDPSTEGELERHVVLNEVALKLFGFDDPLSAVGQSIFADDSVMLTVIGVVKNFHFRPLNYQIGPIALRHQYSELGYLSARIVPGQEDAAVESIISIWKKLDPIHTFEGNFMSTEIDNAYEDAGFMDIITIVGYISFLAISLACLGMLGMAMYSTKTRIKEIGVRKVMGATSEQITVLLSRSFFLLILIAVCIGLPIGYFLGEQFVSWYPYQIKITFKLLFTGVSIVTILGILTISSQTWKAAASNPVKSLRYE
ncbi:MAG: ABC transporter permease [Cyclobacteriaceae bacterium]|nr:ABC transporter permease [Cyclobacteriaceae bacterium]